jgi:hypothetical protein
MKCQVGSGYVRLGLVSSVEAMLDSLFHFRPG